MKAAILVLLTIPAVVLLLTRMARADEGLKLPPEVQARCDAEGGCVLITRQRLVRALREASCRGDT